VTNSPEEPPFVGWLAHLHRLTDSSESSRRWRERRYQFAHRLGDALVGTVDGRPPITGAALYGIWLHWGLLYVGQTADAERRLRDLAIGESHHLANTFPPEIWDRVVIIAWPQLAEADALIARLGTKTVGLALEHRLQFRATPLANATRRTSQGGWRVIDRTRSASLGARAAAEVEPLFDAVEVLWSAAEASEEGAALSPRGSLCPPKPSSRRVWL
jgi:hypothetical protein